MKRYVLVGLASTNLALLLAVAQVAQASLTVKPKVRFAPVEIYIDSGSEPLAAYQFELKATTGTIKIVGVEGGEHPAFQEAPYYDPAARTKNRIIIAAFNTGSNLPHGRTRIATVHLQIIGETEPEYDLTLTVAADAEGRKLPAQINLERGETK